MVKFLSICALASCAISSYGSGKLRYYFAYADATLVNYAVASGADPMAAIGREIPTTAPLRVPSSSTNGGVFQVQLRAIMTSVLPWQLVTLQHCNISYDRTLATNNSINPPLNASSFRKLSYAYGPPGQYNIELKDNFSQFDLLPLFDHNDLPLDLDGDGVQDQGSLRTFGAAVIRASWRSPDVAENRPIGMGADLQTEYGNFRVSSGQSFRFCNIALKSLMANGESYGFGSGETGLQIFTAGIVGNMNSTVMYGPNFSLDQFEGARYNLLAVPEPSSWLVLGLGVLALRRRQ